ncbi:MAG: hypothetical protein AAGG69_01025 [Pseudomonadota bacterium]
MKPNEDDKRAEEAKRVLRRVESESETLGTSSFARAVNHMKAVDADPEDAAELWGKRVGRGLSLIAVAVLLVWLFNYLTR